MSAITFPTCLRFVFMVSFNVNQGFWLFENMFLVFLLLMLVSKGFISFIWAFFIFHLCAVCYTVYKKVSIERCMCTLSQNTQSVTLHFSSCLKIMSRAILEICISTISVIRLISAALLWDKTFFTFHFSH